MNRHSDTCWPCYILFSKLPESFLRNWLRCQEFREAQGDGVNLMEWGEALTLNYPGSYTSFARNYLCNLGHVTSLLQVWVFSSKVGISAPIWWHLQIYNVTQISVSVIVIVKGSLLWPEKCHITSPGSKFSSLLNEVALWLIICTRGTIFKELWLYAKLL